MDYRGPLRELGEVSALLWKFSQAQVGEMRMAKHAFGPHPRQYLLTFEPLAGADPDKPVIYFIHGGGWRIGSPYRRKPLANFFTSRGYAVAMPTYRLTPSHQFPDLREDTSLALAKTLKLPIGQGKRILLIGESAGGNLGALLLYDRPELQRLGASQDRFAGFLSLAGVLDLNPMPDNFVLRSYCGRAGEPMFERANPVNYLQQGESLPALLVHGNRDGLVPLRSVRNFARHYNRLSPGMAEMHVVKGGSHVGVATSWYLKENEITERIMRWIETV